MKPLKPTKKNLVLNRTTLRALQPQQLDAVAGGGFTFTFTLTMTLRSPSERTECRLTDAIETKVECPKKD